MVQVVEKNSIKIGKEPVVIVPLRQWEKIGDMLDDYECFIRYNEAIGDPENQKLIPFEKVKKKLNLP